MYCGQHIKLPKLGMVKISDKQVPKGEYLMLLYLKNQVVDIMYHYAVLM